MPKNVRKMQLTRFCLLCTIQSKIITIPNVSSLARYVGEGS